VVLRAADVAEARTYGVGPCLALALFDAHAKVGVLAHVSPPDDIPASVDAMMRAALGAGADPRRMTARVIGGWKKGSDPLFQDTNFTSPQMLKAVTAALGRYGRSVDATQTLVSIESGVPPEKTIRNLRLDLRSGFFEDLPAGSVPAGAAGRSVSRDEKAPGLMRPHAASVDAPR